MDIVIVFNLQAETESYN